MKNQSYLISLRKKLPPLHDISSFYGTIVFFVYGWTSLAFFWKVPSWIYFLKLGEILVIFAYSLASTLLEAALILLVFLLASLVLPSNWLRNQFVVRSSIIFIALTFWVALFDLSTLIELPSKRDIFSFAIGFPLTAGLGVLLADRMPLIRRLMMFVSDQLIIFLYIWLPLSLIGILIVLLRMI